MARLTKLTVRGFKSIKSLEDFELRNLNVLIGANGAGKSNFIGLFKMLTALDRNKLKLFTAQNGGPDALLYYGRKTTERFSMEMFFSKENYGFSLVPTSSNIFVFEEEHYVSPTLLVPFHSQGGQESMLNDSAGLGSKFTWQTYHFNDTSESAKVKQLHGLHDNLLFKPDAANLAAYLRGLREEYEPSYTRIVETIRLAAPFFGGFVFRRKPSDTIELEWTARNDPDTPLKAFALSDGTLRFICLATLLLQPPELLPDLVLIDEPELGLHPYAINLLSDMLKQAAEQKQIIVSTQSVELLNTLEPEDVVVVDREDDASTFRRLDAASLKDWLEDYALGDLWKQNVFGGRPG